MHRPDPLIRSSLPACDDHSRKSPRSWHDTNAIHDGGVYVSHDESPLQPHAWEILCGRATLVNLAARLEDGDVTGIAPLEGEMCCRSCPLCFAEVSYLQDALKSVRGVTNLHAKEEKVRKSPAMAEGRVCLQRPLPLATLPRRLSTRYAWFPLSVLGTPLLF